MNDEIDRRFLERLLRLIGRDCFYLGKHCVVIDILSDERALILESREGLAPIQTDQYGQATNRSNELLQVPILDEDGTSFSDDILALFAALNDDRRNENPEYP